MPSKKSAANQALGEALRTIRYERGLNQEAFAAHAGLARSNYGAIERGEFNVTLDTIVKVAAGLGVSVAELLSRASSDGRERSMPPKKSANGRPPLSEAQQRAQLVALGNVVRSMREERDLDPDFELLLCLADAMGTRCAEFFTRAEGPGDDRS